MSRLVCAWCNTVLIEGPGPTSHGICEACLSETRPIRTDLVAHLREQIEAGTYETQGKLEISAERIAEELKGGVA